MASDSWCQPITLIAVAKSVNTVYIVNGSPARSCVCMFTVLATANHVSTFTGSAEESEVAPQRHPSADKSNFKVKIVQVK